MEVPKSVRKMDASPWIFIPCPVFPMQLFCACRFGTELFRETRSQVVQKEASKWLIAPFMLTSSYGCYILNSGKPSQTDNRAYCILKPLSTDVLAVFLDRYLMEIWLNSYIGQKKVVMTVRRSQAVICTEKRRRYISIFFNTIAIVGKSMISRYQKELILQFKWTTCKSGGYESFSPSKLYIYN